MDVDIDVTSERNFIQKIIEQCGPRLPGSEEEKRGAEIVANEYKALTGNVKMEEFRFAPKACIAAIPGFGVSLMVAGVLFYLVPLAALLVGLGALVFGILQIIFYKEIFDWAFPKATSQNVYSVIEPPGGAEKAKATLVMSAHIDSSWCCWNYASRPNLARYKLTFGVVCGVVLLVGCILRMLGPPGIFPSFWITPINLIRLSMDWTLFVVPFLYIGLYFLAHYMTYDKKKASPGAMDNLSGVTINLHLAKYFLAHPDKAPQNLRILLMSIGAEEAGLRGSRAFIKRHRNDLLKGEVWVTNVDGVGDANDFVLVTEESWQGVHYDPEYLKLIEDAMQEVGVHYKKYKLDAGGSDSAEFFKAGIQKTITLAAQDQTPKSNYHCYNDKLENMDPEAMRLMNLLCLNVIGRIDQQAGLSKTPSIN